MAKPDYPNMWGDPWWPTSDEQALRNPNMLMSMLRQMSLFITQNDVDKAAMFVAGFGFATQLYKAYPATNEVFLVLQRYMQSDASMMQLVELAMTTLLESWHATNTEKANLDRN